MAGALGMILTKVLSIDEAYHGVDWRTVFLLSGLIPLGLAMQKTQAAPWLAHQLLGLIGTPSPPAFLILIVGLLTTVFTLVVSNVGATVLLVPLVVDMAGNCRCGSSPGRPGGGAGRFQRLFAAHPSGQRALYGTRRVYQP